MSKRPKLKKVDVRLTESLRNDLIEHIKEMIEAVMAEQDIWKIIDEYVQTEYARDGFAWLQVERKQVEVLCSIGSGDAVFRLPLEVEIDIDDATCDQSNNRRQLKVLDGLIAALEEQRALLRKAIGT